MTELQEFECKFCHRICSNKAGLTRHLNRQHSEDVKAEDKDVEKAWAYHMNHCDMNIFLTKMQTMSIKNILKCGTRTGVRLVMARMRIAIMNFREI